jgi:hypothetical protein
MEIRLDFDYEAFGVTEEGEVIGAVGSVTMTPEFEEGEELDDGEFYAEALSAVMQHLWEEQIVAKGRDTLDGVTISIRNLRRVE